MTPLQSFQQIPLHSIQLNGATLSYRVLGGGPPIVLVHGWPLSGVTYRALVEQLKSDFSCYVLDLPGSGNSPPLAGRFETFSDFARVVVDFAARLGLQRYTLIGHDSGGTIARLAAAQASPHVARLILFNTELPNELPWLVRSLTADYRSTSRLFVG